MNTAYYFLISVMMAARFPYIFDDQKMGRNQGAYYLAVQILGLLFFQWNRSWALLVLGSLLLGAFSIWREIKGKRLKTWRLLTLAAGSILYGFFAASLPDLQFNSLASRAAGILTSYTLLGSLGFGFGSTVMIYLSSLLFLINESNLIIRWFLEKLDLSADKHSPPSGLPEAASVISQASPTEDYRAGRVIGALERTFAFIAIITHQYAIFGFILAAKAFARFKEMDRKAFAEYVLIGTLTSILISVLTAEMTLRLIP